jgi:outer membrane biosynthesis protein TonB
VPINPVSPVRYPPALLAQGIEGRVLLRLYVDSAGRVIPDSTRIGQPVAAPFLQPVQFRGPRTKVAAP